MSSLPPTGGITRRSVFAVWAARIASLATRRIGTQVGFVNRSSASDNIVTGNRLPLSLSADQQASWQTVHVKFGNCGLAAAGMQAAT